MKNISYDVKKPGTKVIVNKNDIDTALRIFKKKIKEFEILEIYKEKQEYTKPSEKRKRAKRAAIVKQMKKNIENNEK
jgi:small subunit ribosomal protein S21